MDQAMKKGASLYMMWGLGGVLKDEAPYKGDMEAVDKNYMSAKKALATRRRWIRRPSCFDRSSSCRSCWQNI